MQNRKFSSRISYYIIFFFKSSQRNKTNVFRTQQSTPNQSYTTLQDRDWFWLRKHPCFCSLSWTDLLEQPRYRTAQIITKKKQPQTPNLKHHQKKQKPKPPPKKPHTHHRASESAKEEKSTLVYALSPFFILSLCLKQSPVLTGVCHAFFLFFFSLAQKGCYSANALSW